MIESLSQKQAETNAMGRRPNIVSGNSSATLVDEALAYRLLRDAISLVSGLAWGTTFDPSSSTYCALGAFWAIHKDLTFPWAVARAVAAYNDSIPDGVDPVTRKQLVLGWLDQKINPPPSPKRSFLQRILYGTKG